MFEFNNGILFQNGKACFGVGLSYYASFHSLKMPVPPEEDQLGEMKKDLRLMKEAGFNILRTAAIGNVTLNNKAVSVDTSFIDELLSESLKNELAIMLRIQGYSMNLSGYENTAMIDSEGVAVTDREWSNFILDSVHHKGILSDNKMATMAIAEHFSDFDNLVAFVTYNEPHYPALEIYDYHPHAIEAYRKWLVKNNLMDKVAANSYEPPRRRPYPGEAVTDWINWRLFAIESMAKFLANSAAHAKSIKPDVASLTCLTPKMLEFDNAIIGVDFFQDAEDMDILGITLYKNSDGGDYYAASLIMNCAESAATICKKHYWLIEYNAAVNITPQKFNRETYLALGSGVKGIMYYQWRGDYPFEGSPEPNKFGLLNYDGTKAGNYDSAIKFVGLINKLSDLLVNAEKYRSGIAILHSNYASMYSDAIENGFAKQRRKVQNTYVSRIRRYYTEIRKIGIAADVVMTKHLSENPLHVKALYVPEYNMLSEKEMHELEAFICNGGKVFIQAEDFIQDGLEKYGFEELGKPKTRLDACLLLEETMELCGIKPCVEVIGSNYITADILIGGGYYLIVLVNISNLHDSIKNTKLRLNFHAAEVTYFTPEMEVDLSNDMDNGLIELPEITDGAIIVVYTENKLPCNKAMQNG